MTVPQNLFGAALLDPARPVPDGLTDARDRDAGRRFNVYRNNVAVSLTEAMHSAFPVIAKLLGKQNMDGLAGMYLRAHPPKTPLMMFYGVDFPDFLANMPQLKHLGYLPDIARLELAMRRSYHAADAVPVDPQFFGLTAPELLLQTSLRLAPAAIVQRSDWPIYDIWRFNTDPVAPKPNAAAQDVLITRAEFDPLPHLLPPGGAIWIAALQQGQTLGQALEATLATHPEFDLGPTLALLLQGNAITSLTTKE